jgi:hypothetical protein
MYDAEYIVKFRQFAHLLRKAERPKLGKPFSFGR